MADVSEQNVTAEVGNAAVAVYADITCPWATIVLHRLRRARHQLGADIVIDIRPFPLEIVNAAPTPYDVLTREIPVAAEVEPDIGFAVWDAPEWTWPVTSLPALEAVRASYAISPSCAEEFDASLRHAFFVEHRCISMLDVILDCADRCEAVDRDEIDTALREGRARNDLFEHLERAQALGVEGSPHVFLANGEDHFLPSLELTRDENEQPRVAEDRAEAIEELLTKAMEVRQAD